jgi:hypothetical protein
MLFVLANMVDEILKRETNGAAVTWNQDDWMNCLRHLHQNRLKDSLTGNRDVFVDFDWWELHQLVVANIQVLHPQPLQDLECVYSRSMAWIVRSAIAGDPIGSILPAMMDYHWYVQQDDQKRRKA